MDTPTSAEIRAIYRRLLEPAPASDEDAVWAWIGGHPEPKARPRARVAWGRKPNVYTPDSTTRWERTVAAELLAQRRQPWPVPWPRMRVSLWFYLEKDQRGDVDNFAKAVLDAMQKLVYRNDACVKQLVAEAWPLAHEDLPAAVRARGPGVAVLVVPALRYRAEPR